MSKETRGIVFRNKKQSYKLGSIPSQVSDSFAIPYDKTLFVEGVRVPHDLLPAGFHFLQKWDMACPLYKYGVTAEDIGTKEERADTKKIVRDLRVLLYSYELLFVRNSEHGRAFMATWESECANAGDKRLAFLRAFYQVKPMLCVLPVTWLAEIQGQSRQFYRRFPPARGSRSSVPLVNVEIAPGQYIKCHKGDEESAIKQYQQNQGRRR